MKIKKMFKSNFGRALLYVTGGTLLAQIINLLFTPFITRIYSPEEFGMLTIFTTILAMLSLGAFKYEMGIPIAKNDTTAINVLALSLFLLVSFVTILSTFLFYFKDYIANYLEFPFLEDYWYIIPLGVLLTGIYKILYLWSSRIKDFKNISKSTINQSLFGNISKLLLGLTGFSGIGLILGHLVSQSAGSTLISKPLLKNKKLFKKIHITKMIWCLRRYKNFPIYNLPTHFINTFGEKAPIIFLTIYFGSQIVGFYGLAYTIVRLPMSLIGKAVGDVFYAEAASSGKYDPKKLKALSNNLIKKLTLLGLIPLLVLLLVGPSLFSLVFGVEWYEAGVYARIISIMLFCVLVFAPVSRVYEVFEKQKIKFYIDTLRLILVLLTFGISIIFSLSPSQVLLLYSLVISIIHLIIYLCAQKILNEEIEKLIPKHKN